MKTTVLFLLFFPISAVLFSQGICHSIPLSYKESAVPLQIEKTFRTATCGDDSLLYSYIKEVYLPTASSTFYLDLLTGPQSAWSQAFELRGTPLIKSVQFWGRVYDRANPSQTITAKAYLYSINAAKMPLLKLDSATVLVTTTESLYTAVFSSPVAVSSDFAVVIQNTTATDTLGVMVNNASAGTYGEGLGWRASGGAWQTAAVSWGQDAEAVIAPVVSYDITADFTTGPGASVMTGDTLTYTNLSGPADALECRMYNFHAMGSFWAATLTDSTYAWDHGDGSSLVWSKDATYVYNTPGVYNVTMICMTGFFRQCADLRSVSITVTGIPTGLPENDPDNIIIFPNPSEGEFVLEGGPSGEGMVEVYDITGKCVYRKRCQTETMILDLRHCSPGHYRVRLFTEHTIINKEISLSK